jgi:RNA polymerase sigma factor (sigma-70 family)
MQASLFLFISVIGFQRKQLKAISNKRQHHCRSPPLRSILKNSISKIERRKEMKHYTNSDYALNKYSEGIVYRFANEIVEITLTAYLADNPGKTEDDFRALKKLSDGIYLDQVTDENAQTKKNVPFDEMDETLLYQEPSPEDLLVGEIDTQEEAERYQERLAVISRVLNKLTEVQRRRYLLHHVDGLSTWEIAKAEGVNQSKIMNSLTLAEKKIKKVLTDSKK